MLNTEAVYSDPDCQKILMTLAGCKSIELVDIELWVRMVSWQYFTTEEEKVGLDYFVDVADPDHRVKTFLKFCLLGLVRLSNVDDTHIVCRPLRIIERWEESARKDKANKVAAAVEALRIKITKKDEETAKPVAYEQTELVAA